MEEWVFLLVFRVTIFSFLRRCWCGRDCPANMYEDILDSPKTKSITVSPYFSLCCYLQRVSLPLCTVNTIGADFLCCYFKSQNSLNKILDSSPQQLLKPPRPVEICSSQHLNVPILDMSCCQKKNIHFDIFHSVRDWYQEDKDPFSSFSTARWPCKHYLRTTR